MAGSSATNQTGRTFELTEGQYLALQLDPAMRNYSIEKGMTLQTGPRSVDPGFEIKSPKNIDPGFEIPTKPNPVEDPYYPREQKPSTMTYFYMNPKGGKYDFQAGKGASIVESDSGRPGARKTYELTTNDPAIIAAAERNKIPETTDEKAKLRKSMLEYLKPQEGVKLPPISAADIARISAAMADAMGQAEGEKSTSIMMTKEQFLTLSDRFPEYSFRSNLVGYFDIRSGMSYGQYEISAGRGKGAEKKGGARDWQDGVVVLTTSDPELIREAERIKRTVDTEGSQALFRQHEKKMKEGEEGFTKFINSPEAKKALEEAVEYIKNAKPLKQEGQPYKPLIPPAELYKMIGGAPEDAKRFSLTPGQFDKFMKDPSLQDYEQVTPMPLPSIGPKMPELKGPNTAIPMPEVKGGGAIPMPTIGRERYDPSFYLQPKSAKSDSYTSFTVFPNAFTKKPQSYEIRTNDPTVLGALERFKVPEIKGPEHFAELPKKAASGRG